MLVLGTQSLQKVGATVSRVVSISGRVVERKSLKL
jgi:hypothetical protein